MKNWMVLPVKKEFVERTLAKIKNWPDWKKSEIVAVVGTVQPSDETAQFPHTSDLSS